MFLTYDTVFPAGATEADLVRITRPRPGLPFTPVVLGGRKRLAWTTFTPHQIDLDVRNPAARAYLSAVLRCLAGNAVTTVRLDAVGYAVKTPGTTCFLTPDTLAFATELAAEAAASASGCWPRCTRRPASTTARPGWWIRSTTSRWRRRCCTRCPQAIVARCFSGCGCGRTIRSPCSKPTTASVSSTRSGS